MAALYSAALPTFSPTPRIQCAWVYCALEKPKQPQGRSTMKLLSPVTRLALLGALIIGVAGCSNIKPTEDHLKKTVGNQSGRAREAYLQCAQRFHEHLLCSQHRVRRIQLLRTQRGQRRPICGRQFWPDEACRLLPAKRRAWQRNDAVHAVIFSWLSSRKVPRSSAGRTGLDRIAI